MRLGALAVALGLGGLLSLPLLLHADEGTSAQRLAALAADLRNPDGFRAMYKLVDAGPDAIPILLSKLGDNSLSDERIEVCLREIARTKEGARSEILKLGMAIQPVTRARLARALAGAGAMDAVYPVVDALDSIQEPLDVVVYGPTGQHPLDALKVQKPITMACAAFGEKAAAAIRKRLPKATSSVFRIEAASVLGAVKSAPSVADLAAMADDEKLTSDERVAALSALAAIKVPQARPAFASALGSEDPSLRRAGARGLAQVPDPASVPALARMVEEEKDEDVRLEAARALSVLDDALTAAPLKAALGNAPRASESRRPLLVAACVNGLAVSRDQSGVAEIVKVLDQNLGFTIERIASQALSKIPDLGHGPRERLRAISEDAAFAPIPRACACWILAQRGEEGPLATLLGLTKSKDIPVRMAAGQLLAEGKLEGAIPALEALCADPSEKVRRVAVVALGRSEASIAGGVLVKVARHLDQDPIVRKVYASAFLDAIEQGTLDAKNKNDARALLTQALETTFKDGTISERRAQAGTLAKLGDRGALLRVATAAIATSELPVESRRAAIEMLVHFAKNEAVESALDGLVRDAALGDDAAIVLAKMRKETFFEPAWRERLAPAVPYR